jgi:hypothetical protein
MKPRLSLLPTTIPSEWRNLLNRVKAAAPSAMLGGGCLRDLFMFRTINDLDVFVRQDHPGDEAGEFAAARTVIRETHPQLLKVAHEPYFTHTFNVRRVEYYGSPLGWPPVNLIGVAEHILTSPAALAADFDFGLCQIVYDGTQVYASEAFHNDVENHTFTITLPQTEDQHENTMKRYERLRQKYAFELVPYLGKDEDDLF